MRPRAFANRGLLMLLGLIAIIVAIMLPFAEAYDLRGGSLVLVVVTAVISTLLLLTLALNAVNIREWWRQRR